MRIAMLIGAGVVVLSGVAVIAWAVRFREKLYLLWR